MRLPRESKEEKFRRLAEARVNKTISMLRLLGNLSWTGTYAYSAEQVEQIFTALQTELDKAKSRFLHPQKRVRKRFRFGESNEAVAPAANGENPSFSFALPDGTCLRAVGFPTDNYPAVNIYWDNGVNSPTDTLCFVEFNPEKEGNQRVCVGAYRADAEDTAYYAPYCPAERNDHNE